MTRAPLLLACLVLALPAVGCGDDEEQTAAPEATATATATPSRTGTASLGKISKDLDAKPAIGKPVGAPPARLQKRDIVKGKGRLARPGDTVSMQYVGVSWSTGVQFDASWDRGAEPFTFPLGGGRVIQGWDRGIVGMREGGRRLLVVPPQLAYGPQSPSPEIAPNETLVFVVDLEKIA